MMGLKCVTLSGLMLLSLTSCHNLDPRAIETVSVELTATTFLRDGITTASHQSATIARSGPAPMFVEPFYQLQLTDDCSTATYGTDADTAEQGWSKWWDNFVSFLGGVFII